MKEILENYKKANENYAEKKKILKEKFDALLKKNVALDEKYKKKLERAKKRTNAAYDKITELCRNECPTIHQGLIIPLAEKLSAHFGMPYEIYRPFATSATIIYLRKDMDRSIYGQPTISLTLRPSYEDGWLTYKTGEKTMKYPKGSAEDRAGLNDVYAPLPMVFEDILKLVTHSESEE